MQLNRKLRLLASRVDIINILRRGHLPLWGLVFQSYYHLKKNLLAFRHCYVTMSRVEWGNTPTLRKNQQYFFGTKFNETILIPTCQVKTIIQITCKNKHALYKKKTKLFKK